MSLPWYLSAGLALVGAGLYAWVSVQSAQLEARQKTIDARDATIASLSQQVAQAKQTNVDNLTTIARMKLDMRALGQVSARFEILARERDRKLQDVLKGIADAPAVDDGPISPVLARELERLRIDFAAADGVDKDPSRTDRSHGQ